MVKFGLTCTGVANNVLTFQEDARMHIFSLNLFLEKEKKNTEKKRKKNTHCLKLDISLSVQPIGKSA